MYWIVDFALSVAFISVFAYALSEFWPRLWLQPSLNLRECHWTTVLEPWPKKSQRFFHICHLFRLAQNRSVYTELLEWLQRKHPHCMPPDSSPWVCSAPARFFSRRRMSATVAHVTAVGSWESEPGPVCAACNGCCLKLHASSNCSCYNLSGGKKP